MKRFFTIICAAAAIAASVACSKFSEAENVAEIHEEGELVPVTLCVELPSASVTTRASAYNTVLDYESAVYSIQYLAFKSGDKSLIGYYKTTSMSDYPTFSFKDRLSLDFYAFVNFSQDLSTITSSDELDNLTIAITGNEKTTGFPMFGRKMGEIVRYAGSTTDKVSITVNRAFSRSVITMITNEIAAKYNINELEVIGAYLMNMPSKSKVYYSITSFPSGGMPYQNTEEYDGTFYNYRGRNVSYADDPDGTSDSIVDGVTNISQLSEYAYYPINVTIAQGETHTFATPLIFYHLPCYDFLGSTSISYPNQDKLTAIVMMVKVDGELQYYTYNIEGLVNSSRTYEFSFAGYGASDPIGTRSQLSSLRSSIYIDSWNNSSTIVAH